MKLSRLGVLPVVLAVCAWACACQTANSRPVQPLTTSTSATSASAGDAPVNPIPVIHVFVALCDNRYQGIVPVSASLGNGDNPRTNLYWGAGFGVKTFFSRSKEWELVATIQNPTGLILERCIFKHRRLNVFMIADGYRGREIAQTTWDFLEAAAGKPGQPFEVKDNSKTITLYSGGSAALLVYVGHDGLMDFKLPNPATARDKRGREAIILACASKQYFTKALESTGAKPLLWTTNLMAPEAYILGAALEGWLGKESDEQIRTRAAAAYHKYQKCGLKAASNLFATGW